MEDKLAVGMYVRTKDGIIGKYNVIKELTNVPTLNGYYEAKEIKREYIDNKLYRNYVVVKASHNIVDLLEVGDYVNGSKLLSIDYAEDKDGNCDKLHYYYSFEDDNKDINEYYEELIIKSILTKEMFESMKYEVK